MLGGTYASSYRPLNDAILDGRLQGVVAVVGCNNPRVTQDEGHYYLARELIRSNVLVVQTGCGALASAKQGLMRPEAKDRAGPILKLICETVGIPPVLHMGSCVNNARILSSLSQMVADGGLGEDISQLPVAAVVPEWMCEKSLAIGTYFAASGVYVLYGVGSPVAASRTVTDILNRGWERKTGGKIEFEPNYNRILEKVLDHLRRKRQELGAGTERQQEIYGGERRKALTWWRNRLKNSRKKS
jgi:carbon-monoxide dehydrogenase catalytic subunit